MSRGRVTVIDIANAAGVPKSTVSLVLRGSALVHSETRDRVNAAIRDLGYVYNRGAANLRRTGGTSGILGVIVNDLTNSFFAELAVGIDQIVQSAGLVQLLSNTAESVDRQREVIRSMREHGVSGLIICPARGTKATELRPVIAAGIPVVLAVRTVPGLNASVLTADNGTGIRLAVDHLVGLGHRRIAYAGGFSDTAVFRERLAGWRDGLAAHGLPATDSLVFAAPPSRAGGVEALARAMDTPSPPTALVCFNDATAFGVCDGLRARGLTPGRDVAVIGFDDVIEARSVVPALTTIAVDPIGMGRRAAQMLLKQVHAGRIEPETICSSVRLVIRQSCGKDLEAGRESQ